MRYLLDTHYILWALFEPEKISKTINEILENEESVKYISVISLWEISLKYSIGKLELENTDPGEIAISVEESGFELLNVRNELFSSYHRLSKKKNHKDPFNRMLIWQAINDELILISSDKKIEQYKDDGLKIIF